MDTIGLKRHKEEASGWGKLENKISKDIERYSGS